MLQELKALRGSQVHAIDGKVGEVHHFYFDDKAWTIRYFVVNTESEFANRDVLISVTDATFAGESKFSVNVTKEQVANSPDIDAALPISRHQQIQLHEYYGWPIYWIDHEPAAMPVEITKAAKQAAKKAKDSYLRNTRTLLGLTLYSGESEIGPVDDILIDADAWVLRYMVVNAHDWLPDRQVLIAPDWIEIHNGSDFAIHVDFSREQIKRSPVFDLSERVKRAYEEELHQHYGREGYWLSP